MTEEREERIGKNLKKNVSDRNEKEEKKIIILKGIAKEAFRTLEERKELLKE